MIRRVDMFQYNEKMKIGYYGFVKCGSTSIYHLIKGSKSPFTEPIDDLSSLYVERAFTELAKDPEVKIFAVTRDPIDLIISSYNYISRAGLNHMVADWQIPFDDFLTRMIDPDQYAISLTEDVKRIGESSREALIHVIVHACDLNWMCTKVRDIRRLYGDRFFEFDITEMDTTLLDWLKCNVKDLPDIQNLTTMPSENTAIGWTTLRHKHYAHPMVIRDNLNPYQQKLLTEVSVKTVTWEYRYDIPWLHPSIQPDQTLAGFAHKQHRVAYINVPKCGTMSMDYLLTPFGFEHEVELLSDIQMFIVVRDPVDRLLSGYNFTNKIYDVPSFDQHLIDLANPANKLRMLDTLEQVETWYGHCMPIQKPVFDWYQSHTETPIRIFRLEDTAPLLSWLKTKIPQMKESSVFLQHLNKPDDNPHKITKRDITPAQWEIIEPLVRDDCAMFGYDFNFSRYGELDSRYGEL